MTDRIIALVDMDCFYCQVEARINPTLKGKPMAVVQYNTWKGGGIIAVNYEARDFGVTRHLRGNEAKEKCPQIVLVQVPELRGKADLTKYRDAGREVVNVLSQFSNCVERASVDEAYIDLTQAVEERLANMDKPVILEQLPNTFIVGFSEEDNNNEEQRSKGLSTWLSQQMRDSSHTKLAVAGVIVEEMREAVFVQTGFRCSAGIGHNKILGKLVCGLHKPNRQTILPHSSVTELYRNMPVKKVRHLGGKLGDSVVELLGCKVMADIAQFSEAELQRKFDVKNGTWLYNIARGFDYDLVTPRLLAKSIGCCKAFKGTQALTSRTAVEKWTLDLAKELAERLAKDQEENKRSAKLLTVSFLLGETSSTRSAQFTAYNAERITADAIELIRRSNADQWSLPIKYLGLSAGKFADESSNQISIQNFFKFVEKSSGGDVDNSTQTNVDSVAARPNTQHGDKEQNGSFFMQYFKKQTKGNSESTSNAENSVASTSKDSNSRVQIDGREIDLKIKTESLRTEQQPTSSKVAEQNSNSCDSVTFISLREIFPDINNIDNNLVELLPSPMQRELNSKRKSIQTLNGNNHTNNCDQDKVSPKAELFPSSTRNTNIIHEDKDDAENSHSSDYDPFHLDESTDVDDGVPAQGQVTVTADYNSPFTDSKVSSLSAVPRTFHSVDESRLSEPDEAYIPRELCSKCSKHIRVEEFAEHLDFHSAQELHKELNSMPVVKRINISDSACSKKSPAKVYNGKKRGRPSKNAVSKTSDKKLRSITSFFTLKK